MCSQTARVQPGNQNAARQSEWSQAARVQPATAKMLIAFYNKIIK